MIYVVFGYSRLNVEKVKNCVRTFEFDEIGYPLIDHNNVMVCAR